MHLHICGRLKLDPTLWKVSDQGCRRAGNDKSVPRASRSALQVEGLSRSRARAKESESSLGGLPDCATRVLALSCEDQSGQERALLSTPTGQRGRWVVRNQNVGANLPAARYSRRLIEYRHVPSARFSEGENLVVETGRRGGASGKAYVASSDARLPALVELHELIEVEEEDSDLRIA